MKAGVVLLFLMPVFGLASAATSSDSSDKIVCYFGSWAVWRPGDGRFDVDNIDPFLCTHLIFGFAGLSNQTWEIEVLDPWNELCPGETDNQGNIGNNCAYDRFVALKEVNPDLIILLAVGGWREDSEDYSVMSGNPTLRKSFIDSSIRLIQKHKFDGLDLDWEYPAARGGVPEDRENFSILSREVRNAFDKFQPPLLFTTAMAAGRPTIDASYNIPDLVDSYDQFHIMAYDYHGAFDNYTHHNAPLCPYHQDEGLNQQFNVAYTINYYLELGLPKEKMVMGIPTYGRCWTLDDIGDNGMYAQAHNPSPAGPYIKIPGTLGFNEICLRFQEMDDCKAVNDPDMHEPYFYCTSDKVWCGFDDANSVYEKARFAKNSDLAGVLVWTIDTDDFLPACYNEDFHLIRNIKRGFTEPADGYIACSPTIGTTPRITTEQSTTEYPPTQYPPTQYPPTQYPPTQFPPTQFPPTQYPPTQYPPTQYPPTQYPPTDYPPTKYPPTKYPPTQYPPTQYPPTQYPPTQPPFTDYPPVHPRPDCSQHVDGSTFPHEDCNKYWVCVNGQAVLELCGPGTLFDVQLHICNWENQVDTTHCTLWICEIDNTYLPHIDCDKYYRCYNGSPHEEQCADGLYWNQGLTMCDLPSHVDTSDCNAP